MLAYSTFSNVGKLGGIGSGMISSEKEPICAVEDINAAFEDIALGEERIAEQGYRLGLERGRGLGEREGYHLGYHRGSELGAELGFYRGFLEGFSCCQHRIPVSDRARDQVSKLQRLVCGFPSENDVDTDIVSLRDTLRTVFKKTCSLLHMSPNLPETQDLDY